MEGVRTVFSRFTVVTVLIPWAVQGEPAPADAMLEAVVVQGRGASAPTVPENLPASTAGVDAGLIAESVNAMTSAETLKYLPSMLVRERYIGDRNGIVAIRTTGSIDSAGSIVYADGLLLSNFLGNSYSYPPRWGMVSPEEIARVDVIYGPFSALYPGNSAGGVVLISTRDPERLEGHLNAQGSVQDYAIYGTDERYDSHHLSASLANRMGRGSFWLSADRLDAQGQPMSYATAALSRTSIDPEAPPPAVSGAYRDEDPTGAQRLVFGAYGIDHTVQDNLAFKLAYDLTPTLRAAYRSGLWQNDSETGAHSYLRDAAGQPFYNGKVAIDGTLYTVRGLSPGQSESLHYLHGLSLKSDTEGPWDWEAVASLYDYDEDESRSTTANAGTDSGLGTRRPSGRITDMSGTGWQSLDGRGIWRSAGQPGSPHELSFGYHFDRYELASVAYATDDWLTGGRGDVQSASEGKTETHAVYLQDAWRLDPDWTLVLGLRPEYWRAFDGVNATSTASQPYASRSKTTVSPKVSLSYQLAADWLLRGSIGQAYRFPTVTELFQKISGTTSDLQNDPDLKPEQVLASEFAVEHALPGGLWRASLFHQKREDALYTQRDVTVFPNLTSVQNVEEIQLYGIETVLELADLLIIGLDVRASVTYTHSRIKENARNPETEGNWQPRIPDWRATVLTIYRPSDAWAYALGLRYSGAQYGNLENTDTHRSFGDSSEYVFLDAKLSYFPNANWTFSAGADNLTDYEAYVYHPWPGRTFFANVKYAF